MPLTACPVDADEHGRASKGPSQWTSVNGLIGDAKNKLKYDALNRPTSLKENGSVALATYTYDDLSRRSKTTLGNGNSTSYTYTPQSTLLTLKHLLGGTAQDVTYTYTRDQLQGIIGLNWTNNLYQWTGYSNGTNTYVSNGLNQYTTLAGATPTYDANGNLSSDGLSTYTYDLDNRLRTANKAGSSTVADYDAEGRLRKTTINSVATNLTYDGTELVAEYDGADNVLRRYVHGPGTDEPVVWYEGNGTASKNWLFADNQGSIIATSNGTGNSTASYSYGPYGEPSSTTGVRFRYTGQQQIGDLYYYKARFYSPKMGRFLQTDPIGTADDMNFYAYVGGDSVNGRDPSGQYFVYDDVAFASVGALTGVIIKRGIDLASGHQTTGGEYAAAAISGGAAGLGILYFPAAGVTALLATGAGGGFIGNITKQAIDNKPGSFSRTDLAIDTGLGIVTSLIRVPYVPEIAGITAGANSFAAVGKSTITKAINNTIESITVKTAVKSSIGMGVAELPGTVVGGGTQELLSLGASLMRADGSASGTSGPKK